MPDGSVKLAYASAIGWLLTVKWVESKAWFWFGLLPILIWFTTLAIRATKPRLSFGELI